MTGLAEWLLEAITEDEAIARAAADEAPALSWTAEKVYDGVTSVDLGPATHADRDSLGVGEDCRMPKQIAAHITTFRPARVLAECAAKRLIVKLHEPMSVLPGNEWFNDAHLTSEPMRLCRSCEPERMFRREKSYPCRTIRALAAPYSDRLGFREEWRA